MQVGSLPQPTVKTNTMLEPTSGFRLALVAMWPLLLAALHDPGGWLAAPRNWLVRSFLFVRSEMDCQTWYEQQEEAE
jgi:hypothetical protein